MHENNMYDDNEYDNNDNNNNINVNNNNNEKNDNSNESNSSHDVLIARIEGMVNIICLQYFESVVTKAHLSETSRELRIATGVMLHNEKTLMPLSSLLFSEQINLLPVLISVLR